MTSDNTKTILPAATVTAPMPVFLVGCGNGTGEAPFNAITVAWTGTLASEPPMMGVSIRASRFSHHLIDQLGCYTVNVPGIDNAAAVDYCGLHSGKDGDKLAACGLHALPGSKVCAPVLAECPLTLECLVRQKVELGSHTLFLGEIVAVQVTSHLLDAKGRLDAEKAKLLYCADLHYRAAIGEAVAAYGFTVKK